MVAAAAGARGAIGPGPGYACRPAVGGFSPGDVRGSLHPAGHGIQRGVLEPAQPEGDDRGGRASAGEWGTLLLFSFQWNRPGGLGAGVPAPDPLWAYRSG